MKFVKFLAALLLSFTAAVTTTNAQQTEEPIRIGTTQSLSGRFAEEGKLQLEGLLMWVSEINARGEAPWPASCE